MRKHRIREWCVYWLYDQTCSHPSFDGYIGCCSRLDARLRAHRTNPGYKGAIGAPANFEVKVLYLGPEDTARFIEKLYRPDSRIGWNRYRGGGRSPTGYKHTPKFRRQRAIECKERFAGIPKPIEQREKMRQAALARYAKPGERERTQKAVKKALKGVDRSGPNNSRFGKPVSEETKQKIRDRIAERGGVSGKRNPNYRHGGYSE